MSLRERKDVIFFRCGNYENRIPDTLLLSDSYELFSWVKNVIHVKEYDTKHCIFYVMYKVKHMMANRTFLFKILQISMFFF